MLIGLSRSLVLLLELLMSQALRTAVCGQGALAAGTSRESRFGRSLQRSCCTYASAVPF